MANELIRKNISEIDTIDKTLIELEKVKNRKNKIQSVLNEQQPHFRNINFYEEKIKEVESTLKREKQSANSFATTSATILAIALTFLIFKLIIFPICDHIYFYFFNEGRIPILVCMVLATFATFKISKKFLTKFLTKMAYKKIDEDDARNTINNYEEKINDERDAIRQLDTKLDPKSDPNCLTYVPVEYMDDSTIDYMWEQVSTGRVTTLNDALNAADLWKHRKELERQASRSADASERSADASERSARYSAEAARSAAEVAENTRRE